MMMMMMMMMFAGLVTNDGDECHC